MISRSRAAAFFRSNKPAARTLTLAQARFISITGSLVTSDGDLLSRRSPFLRPRSRSTSQPTAPLLTRCPARLNRKTEDRLRWPTFRTPAGLNSLGRNLYLPTDASGDPTVGTPGGTEGLGSLQQGYLEQSNVSVVDEFINLITSQRAYEANSKVVKAADDMYQQVNNLTR